MDRVHWVTEVVLHVHDFRRFFCLFRHQCPHPSNRVLATAGSHLLDRLKPTLSCLWDIKKADLFHLVHGRRRKASTIPCCALLCVKNPTLEQRSLRFVTTQQTRINALSSTKQEGASRIVFLLILDHSIVVKSGITVRAAM